MLVVSDTTPINYLILINAEHVLPFLYETVIVPSQVINELRDLAAPQLVRDFARNLPSWILVEEADPLRFPLLDKGEASALALAIDLNASALLADDMEARVAARKEGIVVVGTVGIIAAAHRAGLLDFDVYVESLRTTNFRVSEQVVNAIKYTLYSTSND